MQKVKTNKFTTHATAPQGKHIDEKLRNWEFYTCHI